MAIKPTSNIPLTNTKTNSVESLQSNTIESETTTLTSTSSLSDTQVSAAKLDSPIIEKSDALSLPKSDFSPVVEKSPNIVLSTTLKGLIPSSDSNDCPVCEGTDGRCGHPKRDKGNWYCCTQLEALADPDGWEFLGVVDGLGHFQDVEMAAVLAEMLEKSQASKGFAPKVEMTVQKTGFDGTVRESDIELINPSSLSSGGRSSLRVSSKSHPCPACDDSTGRCRESRKDSNFILCQGFSDIAQGNRIGNWISLGAAKGGRWGKFKHSDASQDSQWLSTHQERYERLKREINSGRKELTEKKSLTAEKRHEGYTQLLSELTLHPDDKADLLGRGLTEAEIEQVGYKSVTRYQKLNGKYHPLLAGIKKDTCQVAQDGYLTPVRGNGLIVALILRVRGECDGNRYRWLSGGEGSLHFHKEGKELPVNVVAPSDTPRAYRIGLIDSLAVKGHIAAKNLGIPIIGANGCQFPGSPNALLAGLKEAGVAHGIPLEDGVSVPAEATPSLPEIALFLDAGDIGNQQVMRRWHDTEALLIELGYTVSWAWWKQFEKAVGDIDEIDLTKTSIEYVGAETIKKLARREASRIAQIPLRSLSYEPDLTITTRYLFDKNVDKGDPKSLENLLARLPQSGILAMKAPKGNGKSTLIAEMIKRVAEHNKTIKGVKRYVLSITPRIALGREQAYKWNISWIGDKGKLRTVEQADEAEYKRIEELEARRETLKEEAKILRESAHQMSMWESEDAANKEFEIGAEIDAITEQIKSAIDNSILLMGMCWDSLWKLNGRNMKGSMIILDEAETGISHLLTSSTCAGTRPKILYIFDRIINQCLLGGGLVLLADADLTDIPIDYVNSLLPAPIKPFILESNYQDGNTRYSCEFFTGSSDSAYDRAIAMVEAGSPIAITLDNKREAIAFQNLLLERTPERLAERLAEAVASGSEKAIEEIKAIVPTDCCLYIVDGKENPEALEGRPCILNINSDTTRCAAGKYFVEHPNEMLQKLNVLALVFTPSMGIGVSIDESTTRLKGSKVVPYFEAVFGFFYGVIEPSQARQQLARVRANVPRIVWAATYGIPRELGSRSFFPDVVSQENRKYRNESVFGMQSLIEIRMSEREFQSRTKDNFDDIEWLNAGNWVLKNFYDPKSKTWNNPHMLTVCKIQARQNYGCANFARLLMEELQAEGHHLGMVPGQQSGTGDDMLALKNAVDYEEACCISSAPLIDEEEAEALKKKELDQTKEDKHKLIKFKLMMLMPEVELSPEFVLDASVKNRGGSSWMGSWLKKNQLFYWLTNYKAVQERDAGGLLKYINKGAAGQEFVADFKPQITKIHALRAIGILDWIKPDEPELEYSSASEEAQKFLEKCLKHRGLVWSAFNVSINKQSAPITIVNKLLPELGLSKLKKGRMDDKGHRLYVIDSKILTQHRRDALAGLERAWLRDVRLQAEDKATLHINGVCQSPLPEEPKEPPTATMLDIGESCDLQILEGDFGTSHEPAVQWKAGYKLLGVPSEFREFYQLQDESGQIVPAQEGCFRMSTSTEEAEKATNALVALCDSVNLNTDERLLPRLFSRVERYFEEGLIGDELLLKAIGAIGRATQWLENNLPTVFPTLEEPQASG